MTLYPASEEGLNNITIGGPENHRVAVAFMALFSSPLAAIRWYWILFGAGYAGGSMGRYRFEIFSDNAGKPGAPIATGFVIEDPQYPEFINAGGFPLVGFPSFPVLKKGNWYHFVITNIDPQPTVNYTSFDAMLSKTGSNPDPHSFIEYDSNGANWQKYGTMVAEPFGIFFANGELQGNGGYQLTPDKKTTLCGKDYGFGKLC